MFSKTLLSIKNIRNVEKLIQCRFMLNTPVHCKSQILCRNSRTSEKISERLNLRRNYQQRNVEKVVRLNGQEEELNEIVDIEAETTKNDSTNVYENTEASWYHQQIVSLAGYSDIVAASPVAGSISEATAMNLLKDDWTKMTTQQIVDNFVQLSSYIYCCLKEKKEVNYTNVMDSLKDHLIIMSQAQLELVLKHYQLVKLDSRKLEMQPFIKALDKELLNRIHELALDQRLKLADLIQLAGISKQLISFYKLMKMLKNKIHQMSHPQLIHYSYLLVANNHCPQSMYELEYRLENIYSQMNLNELSLICLLFFKRKYQAKNVQFNTMLLSYCVDHVDQMQSYNVSSIMKFCRSFRNKDEVEIFKKLLLALEHRLDQYSWIVLSHIAQAAANHSLYIESVTNKIMDRFINESISFRLKDFERIAIAVSVYDFGPKHPVIKTIVDQLKCPEGRYDEIKKYTKSVPITCMFLGQTGYYNLSLLEKIMDPTFYTPLYTNMLYNPNLEYLWLDQSIEIEIPEFKGCRLDDKIVLKYTKKYKESIPNLQSKSLSKYNKLALDIFIEFQNIFGDTSVAFTHILPHYMKPDLVIALDSGDKTLPVQEIISKSETIKYIPDQYKSDIKWFAIIIGTHYSCLHKTNQPTGFVSSKMRQLNRLGYTPILVNYFEWQQTLNKSRRYYLESLIHDVNKRPQFKNELFIE